MPVNHNFGDDFDRGRQLQTTGLVGGFCLLLGLAVGVGITQYHLKKDLVAQLDQVRQEVHAVHQPLDQLTGFKNTAHRANSLLARLEAQNGMLYKASQTLQQSNQLHDQVAQLSTKLGTAEVAADKLAQLEGQLQRQNASLERASQQLARSESRVGALEKLVRQLENGLPRAAQAQSALVALERVRDDVINQQCLLPELDAAVQSHRVLEQSIRELASHTSATDRAIDLLAANQSKIQALAIGTEESGLVLHGLEELLAQQQQLQPQVAKLEETLENASALSYQALHVNSRLQGVQRQTAAASANLDELAWLVEYLGSQDQKIAKAQSSLKQLDLIQQQVVQLDACVPELVENVNLVKGLNKTLVAVLGSSHDLRTQLAEIVLMQPAVEQLATQFRSLTAPEADRELVDARQQARMLIESQQEAGDAVFVSRSE